MSAPPVMARTNPGKTAAPLSIWQSLSFWGKTAILLALGEAHGFNRHSR